ncbi:BPK_HP2_G0053590.mRNA.1.CDS.1 [Saccharomyces cerevisiae]|nr:Agc1p [Saccharomyces cerevisiae YJM1332]CAI5329397.1 BPK_HP2_G0053590.mRNA.1.CDS.1 [Saccharomyces cerevisiae]CAI6770140.1 BPK_HP2_G0053590.mRNA.1.CDS.1 [Saccharomyces cerevisiae]CAI6803608.1 BPK_HP1_G0056910.mRNA.1.CDS.1 [Saccharomyces cerevisiae]
MEQINSNSRKKKQQLEVFKYFASVLTKEDKPISISNGMLDMPTVNSSKLTAGNGKPDTEKLTGELILTYDDFIELISSSKTIYSKFTDHSFNLNQIPKNVFGCIFFAIDEQNKGYLTLNDWFYFNNLLEYDNYHLIILYEFFRKFDVENLKAKQKKELGSSSFNSKAADDRIKSINYGNRFLSFDDLLLNLNQFKDTIRLLHESIDDNFVKDNKLLLDWNDFRFLKFYKCYHENEEYLSLNSLVTILQNDLKNEKIFIGFDRLAQMDSQGHRLALSKNQLTYLLRLFYSHRVSADIFSSLNLSNTELLKADNNSIPYNVFKDIFYLFQNFDLLNQIFHKYVTENNLNEQDIREQIVTKNDFMTVLNAQYNKVNNIIEFSPSQINLLFSIVANSKENRRLRKRNQDRDDELLNDHHYDSDIDFFIHNEYLHGVSRSRKNLESFNDYYHDLSDGFDQDSGVKKASKASTGLFESVFGGKKDKATMRSDLTIEDFMKILNPNYLNDLVHQMELQKNQNESLYINYYFYPIFDSLYNFSLGSIAGCIGATVVYPIDFIKTRMQAQRSLAQYKNSIDCLLKIISREGIKGLYSGLGPQLIGVAPEKAIKLTVNDFMRNRLTDKNGKLSLFPEIISGASAGACQVIFTNPLEIVKIRLQVQSDYVGENIQQANETATQIVKKLGLRGLYNGVAACLMRDVPFSAIYFPTYAHLKKDLFDFDPNDKTKRNRLKTWELLTAGAIAGMPAAFLTTPFDVIKTRLQIDPRKGETKYNGIFHAIRTILKEESFRSFFKGGGARVLRSSPQFGFTLAAYELFKGFIPSPDNKLKSREGSKRFCIDDDAGNEETVVHSNGELPQQKFYSDDRKHANYYYKSCQIAKTFIDLDNNFSRFDSSVYKNFQEHLRSING